MIIFRVNVLLVLAAMATVAAADDGQPRILSRAEAAEYIAECSRLPNAIRQEFSEAESLAENCSCIQAIAMPSGDVYLLVSGPGNVGVINVNGATRRINEVRSWSDYLRGQGLLIWAFDAATYRLEQAEESWYLIMEVSFSTEKLNGTTYRWQFRYAPGSFGAEKRYESL